MKNIKKAMATALCIAMAGVCFTGCGEVENTSGLDPDAVLMTVGDDEITLQEGYFMIKWEQAEYETMASSLYGSEWYNEDIMGDGETFLDYLKDQVVSLIEDMYICRQQAESLGISLTEEEQEEIEETAQTYMDANSEETHAAMMSDKETVVRVLENYTLYANVYNEVVKDADTSVTEEEARQMTYSYIYQSLTTTDSEGNQTDYSSSEKETIYELFAEIKEAAEESGDFDATCEAAGYSTSSHTFSADGSDDDSFADINSLAAELEVGGVSDVIPVEGGVFLLCLDTENDEEKTEAKRETLAYEKQEAVFTEWLDAQKEALTIELDEELWAQVSFEEAIQAASEDED